MEEWSNAKDSLWNGKTTYDSRVSILGLQTNSGNIPLFHVFNNGLTEKAQKNDERKRLKKMSSRIGLSADSALSFPISARCTNRSNRDSPRRLCRLKPKRRILQDIPNTLQSQLISGDWKKTHQTPGFIHLKLPESPPASLGGIMGLQTHKISHPAAVRRGTGAVSQALTIIRDENCAESLRARSSNVSMQGYHYVSQLNFTWQLLLWM